MPSDSSSADSSSESNLQDRLARLSPAQRAVLEQRLAQRTKPTSTQTPTQQNVEPGSRSQTTIPTLASHHDVPLSFAQEGLWLLEQLKGEAALYNRVAAFALRGELDVRVLEHSLHALVERHGTLRTTFHAQGSRMFQRVEKSASLLLPLHDLRNLAPDEREKRVAALTQENATQAFDLEHGPIFRASLLQLEDDEHVLLFTAHHLVFDGWSAGVFVRELAACYHAFLKSTTPSLPPLPIQFCDYAAWQREEVAKRKASHIAYWKETLRDAPTLLNLPTDRPRPAIQTSSGAQQAFALSAELSSALKELSRREGATLFMTLLAAFQTLLHRLTAQEDIVVGTSVAGRDVFEAEPLIGFFINTVLLRSDLSSEPTFREFLSRVRSVALGAYAHQALPFEIVVEELKPQRSASYAPFHQAVFVLKNSPTPTVEIETQMGTLVLSPLDVPSQTSKIDLALELWDKPEGIAGYFEYNTDLFDAATIARWASSFETVLQAIVRNPEARLHELPLMSDDEKSQIWQWSRSAFEYSNLESFAEHYECVHQWFEAQAEKTPEAIAVICGEETLTYRELNERANQLAHALRQRGVGVETLIGLCLERSLQTIIGMLGAMKAGAAYVPIDPQTPQERKRWILEDIKAPIILTQSHLQSSLPATNAAVLCLDEPDVFESQSRDNPSINSSVQVARDNLAYVIYTSGSTGQPKGVLIEHRSLMNFTRAAQAAYNIEPRDRVLQFASLVFDASAEEIYPTLTSGATLVLRNDEMLRSGQAFWEQCRQWQISVLDLPTAFWHELTRDLEDATLSQTLRLIIIGGERALPQHLQKWQTHLARHAATVRLVNTYGPTETTVVATMCDVTGDVTGDVAHRNETEAQTEAETEAQTRALSEVPIGRAIAGAQAFVLDSHLQLAPIGVAGELYLGGEGLARGYLHQPELTREKFILHSFEYSNDPVRLYRTGDRVRWRNDGQLEFLGRVDNQIKLRGFRIEPAEIEAVLRSHPDVREALVAARDHDGDTRLVAYCLAPDANHPDDHHSSTRIVQYLKDKLPHYMIPGAFVWLQEWPKTAGGKIDIHNLPRPDFTVPRVRDEAEPPRDDVEKAIAALWRDVLRGAAVGRNDNFFELGGHSLLATQVVSRLRERFGVDVPLRQMFDRPTVATMAQWLSSHEDFVGTRGQNATSSTRTGERFSCFVMGEGTLVAQCVDVLLRHGHEVRGVICGDAALTIWARQRGVAQFSPSENLAEVLGAQPFDWLWSVVNPHLLPGEILGLPQRGAINFHDAPLPKYAGTRATTWAILNREPEHGITWHTMTAQVDAGEIWKQKVVPISLRDTAFSLNSKCYDAAIVAFEELLQELAEGRATPRAQNLEERTFYARDQRPNAIVSWHQSAEEIDALVRALDFGPYPNPLTTPKFWTGSEFLILGEVRVLEVLSSQLPSTIVAATDVLVIATSTHDLAIGQVWTLDGRRLAIADAAQQFGWVAGTRLPQLDDEISARLTDLERATSRHETFWLRELRRSQPITMAHANTHTNSRATSRATFQHGASEQSGNYQIALGFSPKVQATLSQLTPDEKRCVLIAALAIYLARTGDAFSESSVVSFDFQDTALRDWAACESFQGHGLFALYVPLLIEVRSDDSYQTTLQHVKSQIAAVKRHQTFARDVMLRQPALRQDASRSEQTSTRQSGERGTYTRNIAIQIGDFQNHDELEHDKLEHDELKHDVVFRLDKDEATLVYDVRVFHEEDASRMAHQLTSVLHNLLENSMERVGEVSLLSRDEEQMLEGWNNTQRAFPHDTTVHQVFEKQVEHSPNATALVCGAEKLTYCELNERANKLARALQRNGVSTETLVAVCLPRSLELFVALLAILKTGGSYLPLDVDAPPQRTATILQDAQTCLLITDEMQRDNLHSRISDDIRVLDVSQLSSQASGESSDNVLAEVLPHNRAYAIYTSGSTGQPKGVEIEHRSLMNLVSWHQQTYQVMPQDRASQVANVAFDAMGWEVWPYLAAGASVFVAPDDLRVAPSSLISWLCENEITLSFLPTPMAEAVAARLEDDWPRDMKLRALLTGGDVLRRWPDLPCPFVNHYGPTENTVVTTEATRENETKHGPRPTIGKPIANTQVYILDSRLQPLPVGVAGELCVAGAGLARGYLNAPELTTEKFINVSINGQEVRIYRTGDRARLRADGNIEFLGRLDDQIKLRGFRIVLGEIEAALCAHSSIEQASVVVREDLKNPQLVAYYVMKEADEDESSTRMREFLRSRLPDYMIPGVFIRLQQMPLSPNGKIDKTALPRSESRSQARSFSTNFVAPRTPLESAMAQAWQEAFEIEHIGVHNNFFELGGHSILAAQIAARFNEVNHINKTQLSLRHIFEYSTIASLVEYLEATKLHETKAQVSHEVSSDISAMTLDEDDYEEGRL